MVIGVRDLGMRGWIAGGVVTRTMALSLVAVSAKVRFLTRDCRSLPDSLQSVRVPEPKHLPMEWTARKWLQLGPRDVLSSAARGVGVDIVLPIIGSESVRGMPAIGWITDFQHRHLPELLPKEKRQLLDRDFAALAEKSRLVLLSSESAKKDFTSFLPQMAHKARVATFPSLFAFEQPAVSAGAVVSKYKLPARFLLVINQLWRHKNHKVVVEALAILKRRGVVVPLVIAGLPVDYRDPHNSYLSETFQCMASGGVASQCTFLGRVERGDILDLLRTATALVQPSMFEGWNTTVQDAKALGCPTFVSDIPVHREQCPSALGYFATDDPGCLADTIAATWESLPTRPDRDSEAAALREELEFGRCYGRRLLEICTEALS